MFDSHRERERGENTHVFMDKPQYEAYNRMQRIFLFTNSYPSFATYKTEQSTIFSFIFFRLPKKPKFESVINLIS